MLKTSHESSNNVYAEIKAVPAASDAVMRVFSFKMVESGREGRVTHDCVKHSVDMVYANGEPVAGRDAVALSDALLAWLDKNGLLAE